ncbi:MAG: endolytic transglycosylase MltG [Lachnospiraceae bacterium]|nr:endolytic transglycosylase MltG [Lachnospiraceae bacterium]
METARRKKKADLFHILKIVIMGLLIALFIVLIALSYRAGVLLFTNDGVTGPDEREVTYTLQVEKGDSVLKIGSVLKENGIISSAVVFFVQSKLYKCRIAPGTYTLSSRNSSKAILKYLEEEYLKKAR